MSEPVMHQSLDSGPHPDEWKYGESCAQCEEHVAQLRAAKSGVAPRAMLYRVAKEREGGYTQRQLGREIEDNARREGREIQRAGRSWS